MKVINNFYHIICMHLILNGKIYLSLDTWKYYIRRKLMKVVYATRTGNVEMFIDKLGLDDVLQIRNGTEKS